MFSCEFCKISDNILFKESFGRLLLDKHSLCLLSYHDLLFFQKRCHTYFLAEYFFGFLYRLGARVKPIFQTLNQTSIFNPVEHLRWSFFSESVSSLKCVSIFAKKAHSNVRPGSKNTSVSSHKKM